jgi:uncharacterized membrane protein YfcA
MVHNNTAIITVLILVVILVLLYVFDKQIVSSKWYKQIKEWFINQWASKIFMRIPPSDGVFQIAWGCALFFAGIYTTLYAGNNTRVSIMLMIFVIFCICVFIALVFSARNSLRPKDNRLDILIEKIDLLITEVRKGNKTHNSPKHRH